jgi:hypothetical protein
MISPCLEIVRLEENADYGTFGVLKIQKQVFCVTLEPADLLNRPNESCIPAQQYWCNRIVSPKFGETFEVKNVPGRTMILFHPGNFEEHTDGCILLAQHFGKIGKNRGVLNSGETWTKFMNKMFDFPGFHLTIQQVY